MTLTIDSRAEAIPSAAERAAAGKAIRDRVPRSSHAAWEPAPDRPDPLALIAEASRDRVERLIPLRNSRMAASPFAFFRGTANIMAADLATTPVTGLVAQLAGDAHCLNFGAFATPERRLIFDINDFDETLPGPWEWDVKRLAASLVLAARSIKLKDGNAEIAALEAVRAYRLQMIDFSAQHALAVWHARIDASDIDLTGDAAGRQSRRSQIVDSARAHSMRAAVDQITIAGADGRRLIEDPPLLYHAASEADGDFDIALLMRGYAESLAPEVRVLLGRYRLVDHAVKVVGVGSVGTRCSLALLQGDGDDALILQFKQAASSVLERYASPSTELNHGRRVVAGQRLMQTASDSFLGWGTCGKYDFYVRQYRDKKGSIDVASLDGFGLRDYGEMCARALAKGHARSGDAVQIAAYLGKNDTFDKAVARFGVRYADQVEADFATFTAAIAAGTIPTDPAAATTASSDR